MHQRSARSPVTPSSSSPGWPRVLPPSGGRTAPVSTLSDCKWLHHPEMRRAPGSILSVFMAPHPDRQERRMVPSSTPLVSMSLHHLRALLRTLPPPPMRQAGGSIPSAERSAGRELAWLSPLFTPRRPAQGQTAHGRDRQSPGVQAPLRPFPAARHRRRAGSQPGPPDAPPPIARREQPP